MGAAAPIAAVFVVVELVRAGGAVGSTAPPPVRRAADAAAAVDAAAVVDPDAAVNPDAAVDADASAAVGGGGCSLSDLLLLSNADDDGNAQIIDVSMDPNQTDTYVGILDYFMEGFNVEPTAEPEELCTVTQRTTWTTMVDPGSFALVEVVVEPVHAEGGPRTYLVNVSRMTGRETRLRNVRVTGAYLDPDWSPEVEDYIVYLGLKQDFARFTFERLDNGQAVELRAELESPAARPQDAAGAPSKARAAAAAAEADPWGMAYAPQLGEVQHPRSTLITALDLGYERLVRLIVYSADLSATGEYRFAVRRPSCPEDEPFFDPTLRRCTDICNEGFFGSYSTGRCTECIEAHCAVCDSATGEGCGSCFEGYVRQGSGCAPAGAKEHRDALSGVEHEVEEYGRRHWALGLVVVAAVAALLFGWWVASCVCRPRGRRRPRLLDEDEEELSPYFENSYRG